ncbi:MAG: hypothetical protein KF745_02665 [Phycisphaeraceae bacterium]|nr:hypothetical protein [Phycisphaeraceae bacterium]
MEHTEQRITIASIRIEGLADELAQKADAEIRGLLVPFEQSDLELVAPVHLSVLVTDRMAEHVDRINHEHKSRAGPYCRQKAAVASGGIMLTAPGGPPLQITLVLDNFPWGRSDSAAIVERVYMLAFMFGHVLRRGQMEAEEQPGLGRVTGLHARQVRGTVAAVLTAYDIDRTAIALCRHWLRCDNGDPVPVADFLSAGFIDAAHALGERLSVFATIDVQFYRFTGVGLEDLHPRIGPLLAETILIFVHALALCETEEHINSLLQAASQSPGLKEYLLPETDAIFKAISANEQADREGQMAAVFERILGRLGLCIEDLPEDGLHVHVSEPVLCPLTPRSEGA